MFGKNWNTRWTDTINYLNLNFPCPGLTDRLGAHIERTVPAGMRKSISTQLSLGKRTDGEDDPHYAGNTNKRHALRGLLLCQRVYFSTLWAKRTENRVDYVPNTDALTPDWKIRSLAHWGNASEVDLLSAIGMFAPVADANRADLAAAAQAGPPDGSKNEIAGNVTLTRSRSCCIGAAETCYRGVLAWLLQSGIVSLRWFMTDTAPNGEEACNRLFGEGVDVWNKDTPFRNNSVLPLVGTGYILHMWTEQMGIPGWNGHWVISNGDGTICGVNNGEIDTRDEVVLKAYTRTATLRGQFEGYAGLDGYMTKQVWEGARVREVPHDPPKWAKSCLKRFDPLTLPGRL
jgi:hypothetical protein